MSVERIAVVGAGVMGRGKLDEEGMREGLGRISATGISRTPSRTRAS